MRNIFCLIVSLAVLVSCGNGNNKKAAAEADEIIQENRVEVLVFYGAQRCATCRAIEIQTKELVETVFAEDLARGLLVYRTVDMTTPEGEALADSYEVASSSLLIVQHLEGKKSVNNLTRFAFTTARNKPDEFREGLGKEVRNLLGVPLKPAEPAKWRRGWNQSGLTERQRRKTSLTAFDADS